MMWEEEQRRYVRMRIYSIVGMVVLLCPLVLLVLMSPAPIAWFFEGGDADIQVASGGPQSEGSVISIVHTAGLSEECGQPSTGSIIVFLNTPLSEGARVAALGLSPMGTGMAVIPMDLPEALTDWSEGAEQVTARLALANIQSEAMLPNPVREGMYWRLQGQVSYRADLREALAIAPLTVATESPARLAARTRSIAADTPVDISLDLRWFAARRGPAGLPVYCW